MQGKGKDNILEINIKKYKTLVFCDFFVYIYTQIVLDMKVVLLVTGKMDSGNWDKALDDYSGRLKHYIPFETEVIRDVKNVKNRTEAQQKELEGQLILKALQTGDSCVLLDERGKEFTSKQFAAYLDRKILAAPKRLVFVVGGPYGFSDEVYERVSERLSLSKMTFSHQMIRPFFVEQLYRAMTILRGEPYHHESIESVEF